MTTPALVELCRHFAAVVMIGLQLAGYIKLAVEAERKKQPGRVVLLDGKPMKW